MAASVWKGHITFGLVSLPVRLAVAGAHLVSATRQWVSELETPPSELAKRGIRSLMPKEAYEDPSWEWDYGDDK